ncbi:type I-F CRISPR-associated protein Csy1 [Vibrio cholerae]|uniref:type I-F CRISPR-associated protein Csy1 n=1 Tax=Vibrio cholerae TaxID=666 RepID=UPI0011D79D87|nr:type I-F CRISPR-associated protein Csy1 [Vibrio cholerae]NOE61591.1 type I-F CRISPR-associated protein Csy1 [Vibrio cholerae]TXY38918.1 type I-F CRISPR-associated protein Csy1 [Vibrio cholerae]GIB72678.1 type I-F CRISPR-associated protein Csy1 [Vibrio cholerae]
MEESGVIDPAIAAFFAERKDAWLKKNISAAMSDAQVLEKQQECEQNFLLDNWLPDAARRICSRALTTHPSKFSHPSTGVGKTNIKDGTFVTPVLFAGNQRNDGFVRSGNVRFDLTDSVGDAGALAAEDFLRVTLSDGMSVLQHIESETKVARELLTVKGVDYEQLRSSFLAIKSTSEGTSTNSKIKQVYFPVADQQYHLLSLLTHSGHLFELRQRLDELGRETNRVREYKKLNQYHPAGYQEIFGLTTIGFGGTKPANISVLNNKFAGKAHLLASIPPELTPRDIRLPKTDFFKESFTAWQAKEVLEALHRLFLTDYNNINLRDGRDYRIQQYVDLVIEKMWQVRLFLEAYSGELSSALPLEQKIWLYPEFAEQRQQEDEWLDKIIRHIARGLINHYSRSKVITNPVTLADQELLAIEKVVASNKENLR